MWGQYLETGGKSGQAIDMKVPQKLFELKDAWREARSEGDRIKIWHEMLDTYTSNVFSIGIIASVPQVVLVNNRLQNVPDKAIYNWDPGAHFGIYRPCTFWFDSVN